MKRRLLAVLLALGVTAGCGTGPDADAAGGRADVVTAFYPLQFLSTRIGGDAVSVSDLTKPGAEPHDIELSARQVGQISEADLVVYLKGFQPAVDEAVAQEAKDRGFDAGSVVDLLPAAAGHEHSDEPADAHAEETGAMDPHVWLDPVRFATVAGKLGERLAAADPAHAADITARAATVRTELDRLHAEYAGGLKTCARREIVTSHTSFQYLAERYDLHQIGISGISPEAEPAPQHLAEVATEAKAAGTTTIFFETLVSPKVAETIAREVGARTAVLDPLEGLTEPGGDYFSIMRGNLTALRQGLGCTS